MAAKFCSNEGCDNSFIASSKNECGKCRAETYSVWRRKMKKGLIGAAVGSLLALVGDAAYKGIRGHLEYTKTHEYKRAQELDEKAEFILPKRITYIDKSGEAYNVKDNKIIVGRHESRRLYINLNGVVFHSDNWFLGGPDGDARKLNSLWIDGKEHERNEIKDYDRWQRVYEGLIEQIYEEKKKEIKDARKEAEKALESKLKDLSDKFDADAAEIKFKEVRSIE